MGIAWLWSGLCEAVGMRVSNPKSQAMVLCLKVMDCFHLATFQSLQQSEQHVRCVLERLLENQHQAVSKVPFLQLIVTASNILIDPTKAKEIKDWPIPSSLM
ncbi:hypothetical protein L3Q82_014579 [Scortum barcoo]|uniref:Uncharacterized protein n=1 Tax=Scortum barcoo TaxID=214431 RepID=A0ACB8W0F2_9TELE|nr:hypothetical protein L3Q82_014579 [Scortum barcoo]